jgi:hypothetical protein
VRVVLDDLSRVLWGVFDILLVHAIGEGLLDGVQRPVDRGRRHPRPQALAGQRARPPTASAYQSALHPRSRAARGGRRDGAGARVGHATGSTLSHGGKDDAS